MVACLVGFLVVVVTLLERSGQEIAVRELTIVMVGLAYIFAPALNYFVYEPEARYQMHLDPDEYFAVIGALWSVLYIGMLLPIWPVANDPPLALLTEVARVRKGLFGYVCVIIGFAASAGAMFAPDSLGFAMYLLKQLRYVGIVYLLMSRKNANTIVAILVYCVFALGAILSGLFFDLLAWSAFFLMYLAVAYRPSRTLKYATFACGIVGLLVLQSVKIEYRKTAWHDDRMSAGEKLSLFGDLIVDSISNCTSENAISALVTRVNQGWIFSRVIERVPSRVPFENGKMLLDDVRSALLPRILYPEKKAVGGRENQEKFTKYTGRRLVGETTMRVGAFSDAYINGGVPGGMLIVFVLGIAYGWLLNFFRQLAQVRPAALFWLPFVYSYAIRFSDILVILNSAFKSLILFMALMYLWSHRSEWLRLWSRQKRRHVSI